MCFCESDAVKILIHVKTRQHYPGILFHETTLSRVAKELGLTSTLEIRQMSQDQLAVLAATTLRYLPPEACPHREPAAQAAS